MEHGVAPDGEAGMTRVVIAAFEAEFRRYRGLAEAAAAHLT